MRISQNIILSILCIGIAFGCKCNKPNEEPNIFVPPLKPGIETNFHSLIDFLYQGSNPVQTGVAEGIFDLARIAVLRGIVKDKEGKPFEDVQITCLGHSEFGETKTRQEGIFDFAVNGGTRVTIKYFKKGFIPIQRDIRVPVNDFEWLPDVILIPYDEKATEIDFDSASTMQIAQGSEIIDDDGKRKATLLFQKDSKVEIELPDGSTQSLNKLTIRNTEFTVGGNGPNAMPGNLPPSSGYTYAVEFSADEAVEKGAVNIRFNKPVFTYVDNFLNFPTGGIVPVGYYDRERGIWIASDNGKVIKIVGISDGKAEIDSDGDGIIDDEDKLATIEISDEERTKLAGLYEEGKSLWRIPITHFTPWDCNWPYGPPTDATSPPDGFGPKDGDPKEDAPCEQNGSIIECQNQVVGEEVSIAGTGLTLNYRSDRVPGRKVGRIMQIPLSGESLPNGLKRIDLEILASGQKIDTSFQPLTNLEYDFEWDGKDGYGRYLNGTKLTIKIGYVYEATYYDPANFSRAFAMVSGRSGAGGGGGGGSIGITGIRARQEVVLWREYREFLDWYDEVENGFGGWSLNINHTVSPFAKKIIFGNGKHQNLGDDISIFSNFKLDSILLIENHWVQDGHRFPIVIGNDNCVYYIKNNQIFKFTPAGENILIAGNGQSSGYSNDGEKAVDSKMWIDQRHLNVSESGEVFFVDNTTGSAGAPFYGPLIRKIDSRGIISTVFGKGSTRLDLIGSNEILANEVFLPYAFFRWGKLAYKDGYLFLGIQTNFGSGIELPRIYEITPSGFIRTKFTLPSQLYFSRYSDMIPTKNQNFIISTNSSRVSGSQIKTINPFGEIVHIAGKQQANIPVSYDGDFAEDAEFSDELNDIALGSDNVLYVADYANYGTACTESFSCSCIRAIDSDGRIHTILGSCPAYSNNDEISLAKLGKILNVATNNEGDLYIAENITQSSNPMDRVDTILISKLSSIFSSLGLGGYIIPSKEGKEVYLFDNSGRHLFTKHALTGANLYSFSYEENGLLSSIEDGDGNKTKIERNRNKITIVAPYGQRTELELGENGYLKQITNPANESHSFAYKNKEGLLSEVKNPNGNTTKFFYDDLGRFIKEENPLGGNSSLTRNKKENGREIIYTNTSGISTTYSVEQLPNGNKILKTILPNNTHTTLTVNPTGKSMIEMSNGATYTQIYSPDRRWGMLSPITSAMKFSIPNNQFADLTLDRKVVLSNPKNPFSLRELKDVYNINGNIYTVDYDGPTRRFTSQSPAGRVSFAYINELGRQIKSQVSELIPIEYTYDINGRLSELKQADTNQDRIYNFEYNQNGYLFKFIDPLQIKTIFQYDLSGKITKTNLPTGNSINYAYDVEGNLISLTPPGKSNHRFTYNALGYLTEYIAPSVAGGGSNKISLEYSEGQKLTKYSDSGGNSIFFNYDEIDRIKTISTPRGNISYTYNECCTASIISSDNVKIDFGYEYGIPTMVSWTGPVTGVVQYGYSRDLKVNQIKLNNNFVIDLLYDQDNLIYKAKDLDISRNSYNTLINGTKISNVSDSLEYNKFGEVENYTANYNDLEIFSVHYKYDALSRITEKVEKLENTIKTTFYVYDLLGQIRSVKINNNSTVTYNYDSNGNRLNDGTDVGTYDAQDRLQKYGNSDFIYTPSGQLLQKTTNRQTTTYKYDILGNLIEVSLPNGKKIEYLVDGLNRRVGRKVNGTLVTGYIYDGMLNPIAEIDASGNIIAAFIYGTKSNIPNYLIKNGQSYRIISDHLGSPRLVINIQTGAIVQKIEYDAWGNVIFDSNPSFQPFGFAGGIYDYETRLTRFGARDYDAQIGRWTTKEPNLFNDGSTNLYIYSYNDPVNLFDLNGLEPTTSNSPSPDRVPTDTYPACGNGPGYYRPQPRTLSGGYFPEIIDNPDSYYAPSGPDQENWNQYSPGRNTYGPKEPNPFNPDGSQSPLRTIKHLYHTRILPKLASYM